MEKKFILDQYYALLCEGKEYSGGMRSAISNYRISLSCNAPEYIVREMPARTDIEDFVNLLRISGIWSIVLTDESHRMIEILHIFAENRCKIDELATVAITDESGTRTLKDIRIKL